MARTRASKSAAGKRKEEGGSTKSTSKKLDASIDNPPQIFILPKDASPEARIVTISNPATLSPNRYFVCPNKGFYEFTRIAAPKSQKRSWLLAPDRSAQSSDEPTESDGYVLQQPDMFVATPIDPLFLLMPALLGEDSGGQEFLAPSDFTAKLSESSPQVRALLRTSNANRLEHIFESRIESVCDCMDMGDEKMYALSLPKLTRALIGKARRMCSCGLPASMEERFVKQVLDVPELSIKREESGISLVSQESAGGPEGQTSSAMDSQGSTGSTTSIKTAGTAATSVVSEDETVQGVRDLLRLRVALDFIQTSYVLPKIKTRIAPLLEDAKVVGVDFSPLEKHMAHIAQLKKDAQALRSLSDNISRKRAHEVDEEAGEKAAEKRRKQEEEDKKKKNVSQGVKKLAKADTSGMKKMSSFFTKMPAKK